MSNFFVCKMIRAFSSGLAVVGLAVVGLTVTGVVIAPPYNEANAWLPKTGRCSSDLSTRLKQAKGFLVAHQSILANDYEVDSRRGQERRAKRQILRRVEKISFTCKSDRNCDTHTAFQSVVGGNNMRICEASLRGKGFCEVVAAVAHEFGHNSHIPKARAGRHHKRGHDDPDKVYQFGYFAQELCQDKYGMGFKVGEPAAPTRNVGFVTPKDIVLYPRKNRKGYPLHFSVGIINGEYSIDRVYWRHSRMNDLRFIGRNDAFSSMVINRGRWEVCTKRNYGGRCATFSSSTDNLSRPLELNNKISSIRYLGD